MDTDEELLDVVVHIHFAYDVGYEIDLEQARPLIQAVSGALPRRRRTPESIRYRPAPVRAPLEQVGLRLPGGLVTRGPAQGEVALFDFGALSLSLHVPIRLTPSRLLRLAGDLADTAPMHAEARRLLEPCIERIRPAILGFELSELSEEYIVFQVVDSAARAEWLETRADWIAGLVRLEADPLSPAEIAEATRLSLAYTPRDLVTLDWAAGFVADRDCAETLQVIEFANVQLLEFRHIDDRLDDRLEAAYRLIRPIDGQRRRRGWWRSHDAALRSVRELEIEATSLFERADNALKLIGDQYLSRVFDLASTRFHLPGWQQSIRRKLDTVGDVFDLLVQQSGGLRMELLEMIVVVLIALEIVLAIFRH